MNFLSMILADKPALIPIAQEVRNILEPVMLFLLVALSIAMTVAILKQSGDPEDLTAITGGSSDNFYGKSKGRGKEAVFKKVTIGIAISIGVVAIAYFLFQL